MNDAPILLVLPNTDTNIPFAYQAGNPPVPVPLIDYQVEAFHENRCNRTPLHFEWINQAEGTGLIRLEQTETNEIVLDSLLVIKLTSPLGTETEITTRLGLQSVGEDIPEEPTVFTQANAQITIQPELHNVIINSGLASQGLTQQEVVDLVTAIVANNANLQINDW